MKGEWCNGIYFTDFNGFIVCYYISSSKENCELYKNKVRDGLTQLAPRTLYVRKARYSLGNVGAVPQAERAHPSRQTAPGCGS